MKIGNPADKPALTPATGDTAKTTHGAAATPAAAGAAKPEASAKIELSSATSSLLAGGSSGEFDAQKVAQVSQAMADGSYKVHPEVIADKLIANASELLGRARH